jgi:hypothetical protein
MKSEPSPPMTLGNAAKAELRLIVWCRRCGHQVDPDLAQDGRAICLGKLSGIRCLSNTDTQ